MYIVGDTWVGHLMDSEYVGLEFTIYYVEGLTGNAALELHRL